MKIGSIRSVAVKGLSVALSSSLLVACASKSTMHYPIAGEVEGGAQSSAVQGGEREMFVFASGAQGLSLEQERDGFFVRFSLPAEHEKN